jgi:hypothetical protein
MSYLESIKSFGSAGVSPPGRSVLIEAIVVAIISVIMFALIHGPMMCYDPEFSMSHAGIFLGVFLTGILFHVSFEELGLNKMFCDNAYIKTA